MMRSLVNRFARDLFATKKTFRETNAMKAPRTLIAMAICLGLVMNLGNFAEAQFTPEHPAVQKMVKSAVAYLATAKTEDPGQRILFAYAHYKVEHDAQAPVVAAGVKEALHFVSHMDYTRGGHVNYEAAVSVLLLASIDPKKYDKQLRQLQDYFFTNQHHTGAWTYFSTKDGDVSQTQYALLAIWTMDRAGIPLDYKAVSDAVEWLLRVQDPKGGFPYHGVDPGKGKPNRAQKRVDTSMSLAGASSVLIAGDALRLWGDTVDDTDPGIPGLPKAVKIYKEDANQKRRKRATITSAPILRSCQAMEGWRKANPYKRNRIDYYYYQMYTMERYESFIEIANGRPKDSSPDWYNRGVQELQGYQEGDGSFGGPSHTNKPTNTAFAILFLIRSTQRAIFTMGSGAARGGYGFEDDLANAKLVGGQVETKKIATQVNDLLGHLEADNADQLREKSLPDDLELSKNPKERAAQMDRLERLVRGSKSWQARRVAARLLGKSDEMRVVPALIFALSDPDLHVRRYARDGLRFISRKFEGFGMPDKPSRIQLTKAQRDWRGWYKTIYPGYVFIDYDL